MGAMPEESGGHSVACISLRDEVLARRLAEITTSSYRPTYRFSRVLMAIPKTVLGVQSQSEDVIF
jgi:hypothetical protein